MPTRTFCIGFEDPRFDESTHARDVARAFGCEHTAEIVELEMLRSWPTVLRHLDQPHGDASFMPTLRVSQLAARHVKVVLTGDGGDELFAGYDKYAAFFSRPDSESMTQEIFERAYFNSISLFTSESKLSLYTPDTRDRLAGLDSFQVAARPWLEESRHLDRVNQCLYLDMMQLLPGNNLVKPDRMGMAASIEARTPLLDWRVMEFAFRSSGATKLASCGDKKHWFKRSVASLIGAQVAHRRKQMFTVPIGEWFRGQLHGWLRDLLYNADVIGMTFSMDAVESMLETHRTGAANWTRQLRALAAVAIWHRLEVEQ
jgi:asparagine synthase (glutamine-hydrolysing)